MFTTLTDEQLRGAHGGVKMKLTQFGYPNDPYSDSETRKGHGAYHSLDRNSIALTDSGLHALGLTRHQALHHSYWVQIRLRGGGLELRRIDDRAPQREMRADLYMPRRYDPHLGDHADVQLIPRAIPVRR